jgi:hypothetical protein
MAKSPLTDKLLVVLIQVGWLRLDGGSLVKWNPQRKRFGVRQPVQNVDRRWKYNLKFFGYSRKIQRSKLHFMIANTIVVPHGQDVDHRDYDNQNDDPDNLRLRCRHENRSDNVSRANMDEAMDFFDKIARQQNAASESW